MKKTKMFLLLIAMLFAITLASCGGGGGGGDGAGQSGPSTGVWDSSRWDDGSTWGP